MINHLEGDEQPLLLKDKGFLVLFVAAEHDSRSILLFCHTLFDSPYFVKQNILLEIECVWACSWYWVVVL